MRNWPVPAAVLMALMLFSGCTVINEVRDERYNINNRAGENWLSDQSAPARIDVSGRWASRDWGSARFHQSGRRVTGTLGDYSVRGVVSGSKAYLLIASGDWYYYSAILEKTRPDLLTGRFSRVIPFVNVVGRPMRLQKQD